jgi:hypothetical protein
MISYNERARLMRSFRDEPGVRVAAMLKCAVCVTLVAALLVISNRTDVQPEARAVVATTQPAPTKSAQ